MQIPQESNEEIPIIESGEGSQSDKESRTNEETPIMDEKSLKGQIPIMEVYKESNKKSKKRKAMEIIPRIVKKLVKRK
jgi:hypothetical protein